MLLSKFKDCDRYQKICHTDYYISFAMHIYKMVVLYIIFSYFTLSHAVAS